MDAQRFCAAIKEARLEMGISIAEAARRAGINAQGWNDVERGHEPAVSKADKMAAVVKRYHRLGSPTSRRKLQVNE